MNKHLVICGNGASAAALLVGLAKQRLPLQVTVIGNGPLWRGVAYSTANPNHFLNVPSSNMSIDSEDEDHFQRWLVARDAGGESLFVPRGLYGAYLEDSVHRTLRAAPWLRVEHISAELLGLTRQPDRWHVFHGLGVLSADAVVLATGIERPSPHGPVRHVTGKTVSTVGARIGRGYGRICPMRSGGASCVTGCRTSIFTGTAWRRRPQTR